jgi:hypothetical protein
MDDPYSGWDPSYFSSPRALPAPQYLALSRADAEQQARASGITAVRVADLDRYPSATLRMDRVAGRLTLLVDNGRVVRAAFF